MTSAEYQEYVNGKGKAPKPPATKSKLLNEPTEYNGRTYASKKEANRAKQLDWKKQLGMIKDFKVQVPYKLEVNGILICTYILDFLIENNDGSLEYEDTKGQKSGVPYQLFKLKKHLMKAIHGITVKEV